MLYVVASEKMREAEEMMSKMLEKPLVNQTMNTSGRRKAIVPNVQLKEVLMNAPQRAYSPEQPPSRPHNYVDRDIDEVRGSRDKVCVHVGLIIFVFQLHSVLCALIQNHFVAIDQAFKTFDRKGTGRFHLRQFGEVLQMCEALVSLCCVLIILKLASVSCINMYVFAQVWRSSDAG